MSVARARSGKGGPPAAAAIGCDVGGTTIKLVRLRRQRLEETSEASSGRRLRAAAFIGSLAATIGDALASAPEDGAPIGVAVPGFLDESRRRVLHLSNLPLLDGTALADRLERKLGREVLLEADTNAGAVGEARLGAGRRRERVLYLTLGTGVGAALAVKGRPVRVSHHTVGQVAHLPLRDSGPRCSCGQPGCAESLLSARGLLRRAGLDLRVSPRKLFDAAEDGDRDALALWSETGELLGRLVRILAPLFDPDVVVVGGGISAAARHFLPAARASLLRTLPRSQRRKLDLEVAELGQFAGAAGVALLAAQELETAGE